MYFTNCFKFFADAIELMASDQKQHNLNHHDHCELTNNFEVY